MTANWLGIGGIVIVVVLAICVLIPRPGAELAVSRLPFPKLGNDKLKPSWWSVGSDGQKKDANARAGSSEQTKQPGGQSGQTSGAGNQQSQSGQSSHQPGQQNGSSQGQQNNSSPSNQQNNNGNSSQQTSSSGSTKQAGGSGQKTDDPMNKSSAQPMQGSSPPSGNPMPPANMPPGMSNPANSTPPPQGSQAQTQQPTPQTSPQPQPSSPPSISNLLSGLGNLVKLIIYAAVVGLIAFLAWKYRRELVAAWQQLLKELRELWARLFGGRETTAATEAGALADAPTNASLRGFCRSLFHRAHRPDQSAGVAPLYVRSTASLGTRTGLSATPARRRTSMPSASPRTHRNSAAKRRRCRTYYGQAGLRRRRAPATIADPLRSLWHKIGASAGAATVGHA